jgi:hypothetical protein
MRNRLSTSWDAWNFRDSAARAAESGTIVGYRVHATDGDIGEVDDASNAVDESSIVVDTGGERASDPSLAPGAAITLEASSMLVLREVDATEVPTDDSVEASLRVQTERADAPSPAPAAELPR